MRKDTNISVLPLVDTPNGDEDLLGVQDGENVWMTPKQMGANVAPEGIRERLTGDRTYYVRIDGSDSNSGLSNTSGGALLTIQKALDVISNSIDLAGFSVTVQVGHGTYTGPVKLQAYVGSPGEVFIIGNRSTPSLVIISSTDGSAVISQQGSQCRYSLDGFKVQTTTSGYGIAVYDYAQLFVYAIDFGACADVHNYAGPSGRLELYGDYTISGDSPFHLYADQGGFIYHKNLTITASGSRAFSRAFAHVDTGGIIYTFGNTYVGTFKGRRFEAGFGGQIQTLEAGVDYFPGDVAGVVHTGGLYS